MKTWIRVSIPCAEPAQDALIAQLALLGLEGFVQESDHLDAFMSSTRWTPHVRDELEALVLRTLGRTAHKRFDITYGRVREQNWNAAWERTVGIVDATPRIVIKPSWKNLRPRDKGKIVLHIDPKMSFGTGHHETTRICLTLLEEFVRRGDRVLDFGTGTGVLAIASVKLGARTADAVDNDPWCEENATENVSRNRVHKKVKVILAQAPPRTARPYDLIVANIDLPTITKTLKSLVTVLAPGGTMILSGLLATDILAVSRLILKDKKLTPLALADENEWVAITMMKAR